MTQKLHITIIVHSFYWIEIESSASKVISTWDLYCALLIKRSVGKNEASLLQACISSMEKQTNKTKQNHKEVKATPQKRRTIPIHHS